MKRKSLMLATIAIAVFLPMMAAADTVTVEQEPSQTESTLMANGASGEQTAPPVCWLVWEEVPVPGEARSDLVGTVYCFQ